MRYYGPYKDISKRNEVTYVLEFLPTLKFQPEFHVSLLKKRVRDPSQLIEELPKFDDEGKILL